MKLNFDCIRDTLLYLEEALVINFQQRTFESISLNQLIEDIMLKHTHYEANEIWYSVYSLKQAGFIEGRFENPGNKKLYIYAILKTLLGLVINFLTLFVRTVFGMQ